MAARLTASSWRDHIPAVALFSRRSKSPSTAPDAAFPYWDQPTADQFRALVRASFAESGSEVEVFVDHVVDARGAQFGLGNLAAVCHNDERGRRAWPELVARHVRTIMAGVAAPSPFDVMSEEQILAATYGRVMPTEDVLPTMSYAREIAPGLSMVFNLDLPESVAYFTDEHVARFGYDLLLRTGKANLSAVTIDERTSLDHERGRVEVLLGESLFTASLILILEELLRRDHIELDPQIGAFVAVPYRHQLDFHIPRDADAIPSLQLLASFAAAGYRDSAGPVSPSAYWWRPHAIDRISVLSDDGIRIEVSPELTEILNQITEA